ncbi:MAG: flagellar filament capping protein FliD, partial [Sulfurimonas sp.]|nr:flagellar filament capping protein FliD [Sulfurimonas sp.]
SINQIKTATLWDERSATVSSGTSVEVSALSKTDVQDFTINVNQLATKQIEQSAAFTGATEVVDAAAGSFDLQVGAGAPITINYAAGATLDDIKDLINAEAGDLVDATIVQLNTGEYHLMLSSAQTGADTNISVTGATLDARLTTGLTEVQAGQNAMFTFNGGATVYERSSNEVDDLITGLNMTFKETGFSAVSIAQDRTSILEKFDSFVEKYNSAISELDKMTKISVDDDRGIFSSDSTIKGMKRDIEDLLYKVGGGVGSMIDYGFDIDKEGVMTLDKTVLEKAMDDNPTNVQSFFSGGDFTKADGSVVAVTGAFTEMSTIIEGYTKTNKMLDQLNESITQNISSLEDRKLSAIERLDAKYEIMAKQWAAYDLIISQFNSASSMFTELANASSKDS